MNTQYQKVKERRLSLGLCIKCGKNPPEKPALHCSVCLEYVRNNNLKLKEDKYRRIKIKQAAKARYLLNREKDSATIKEKNRLAKLEVVSHYGGRCNCCGELNIFFLCVDHINNDGNEHRKTVPNGSKFYTWIIKNDFPDYLQILCYNCNQGKRFTGICPHKY